MGYCAWAGMNEANRKYHDTEWGIPVHDDRHMFEHLTLECLQCGLSWDLMLKKREIFRECFVQPGKIEIDANERAVIGKRNAAFSFAPSSILFVCTIFDSFLNDLYQAQFCAFNRAIHTADAFPILTYHF